MSQAAAGLPNPRPQPDPRRPAPSGRTIAARPLTHIPPHSRRGTRRGPHPAFFVFAAVVVACMLVVIVVLNAVLAQQAIAIRASQQRLDELTDGYRILRETAASASSPWRIGGWAEAQGFIEPRNPPVVLRDSAAARRGTKQRLDPLASRYKPTAEGE